MSLKTRSVIVVLLVSAILSMSASAQSNLVQADKSGKNSALNTDNRRAVIATAFDSRHRPEARPDCSHLVHTIYSQAGLPYPYASSTTIYNGASQFQRVKHPRPADLVVWPGHVGIVVNPAEHSFFSFLRSGAGVDYYDAPYWKQRGHARFYRYVKITQLERSSGKPRGHAMRY
jgi:hypothetical protein